MTFITDRNLEAVKRVKQGATDEETLLRGTLRPVDFQRWKEALSKILPETVLPDITKDTQINCTNPEQPLTNIPGEAFTATNDCWYYWKAIKGLKDTLPENSGVDTTWFPDNMERLTCANVNALEAVIEYHYTHGNGTV